MKSQGYYLSVPLDPWREDNNTTSMDVTENGLLQYKRDSIVNRIGNESCQYYIDMYFNELKEQFDDQKFRDFCADCLEKIKEEYDLDILSQFLNYYRDCEPEFIFEVLSFFERGFWKEPLKEILPSEPDILVFSDKELKKYIKESRKVIRKKLFKVAGIPDKIKYALYYCSKDNLSKCLLKLIKKDKHELVVKMLEEENGNN